MAQITIEEITEKIDWENFMDQHPESNFLQSFNWGKFHQNLGKTIYKIGFKEKEILVGVMLCIVEKAKRATYLTVPGGPLISWEDETQVSAFIKAVKDLAKRKNCSFVRIRPQIIENEKNKKLVESLGFKIAPMHLHAELTRQLDLTKTKDELMIEMRKTTRYEIKQAIKLGIKISVSKDPKELEGFYNLQKETAKRQRFVEFNKRFLQEQFEVFAADNQVLLYTATLNNVKLAQAFIIFYGSEADYHYGASTLDGRKYPGAYLIQWEAIKEAKKRGMTRYNLWGVAPEGETNHRFWGVSIFKRGFGGEDVSYLHARDLIVNSISYKVNWLIEATRKKVRRV